jgi:hypothetical protein
MELLLLTDPGYAAGLETTPLQIRTCIEGGVDLLLY